MNKNKVKPYIQEALLILLKKYSLKEITIKMLVDKAGICRASFYRNYVDTNDVIKDMLRDLFEVNYSNKMDYTNYKHLMMIIFESIYEKREIFDRLIENELDYFIQSEVYNIARKHIDDLNIYKHRYQPCFFAGASSALLISWAKNGYQESPEEMLDIFINTLKGYMEL